MKNFDQPLWSDPTPRGYDLNKLGCILPEDASTHIYIWYKSWLSCYWEELNSLTYIPKGHDWNPLNFDKNSQKMRERARERERERIRKHRRCCFKHKWAKNLDDYDRASKNDMIMRIFWFWLFILKEIRQVSCQCFIFDLIS